MFFEVIHQILRSHGPKIDDLNPILRKITRLVAAIKPLRFALFILEQAPEPRASDHTSPWTETTSQQ